MSKAGEKLLEGAREALETMLLGRWADHPMITVTHAKLLTRRLYDVHAVEGMLIFAANGQLVKSLPITDDRVSRDAIHELRGKAEKEHSLMDVPEDIRETAAKLASMRDSIALRGFIAQALLSERLAQKERDAKTMRHLGNVLQLLAELHPDDRCRVLDSALEFFNRENPNGQIEAAEGHVSRLVIEGPLQRAIR